MLYQQLLDSVNQQLVIELRAYDGCRQIWGLKKLLSLSRCEKMWSEKNSSFFRVIWSELGLDVKKKSIFHSSIFYVGNNLTAGSELTDFFGGRLTSKRVPKYEVLFRWTKYTEWDTVDSLASFPGKDLQFNFLLSAPISYRRSTWKKEAFSAWNSFFFFPVRCLLT